MGRPHEEKITFQALLDLPMQTLHGTGIFADPLTPQTHHPHLCRFGLPSKRPGVVVWWVNGSAVRHGSPRRVVLTS